jgi:hypothetical protein
MDIKRTCDYIIYEAKKKAIAQKIIDTVFSLQTKAIVGYKMHFPELKAGSILEIYYQAQGVAIPYFEPLTDALPLKKSELQIEILSAYPLVHKVLGSVQDSVRQVYDYQTLYFKAEATSAYEPSPTPHFFDSLQQGVFFAYADLIIPRDREAAGNWPAIFRYHFYQGEINDYTIFMNSEAYSFGQSVNWGSLNRPKRYFRFRADELIYNQVQTNGQNILATSFTNPLVALQDWTNKLIERPNLTVAIGLALIDEKILAYLEARPNYTVNNANQIADYSLLAKFYLNFLAAKVENPLLFFAKTQQQGPIHLDFKSAQQFQALGLAYRDEQNQLNYKVIGPYLGQNYPVNTWPADFNQGQILLYNTKDEKLSIHNLPAQNGLTNGVQVQEQLQVSFTYNWVRNSRSYRLKGLFKNKMYHAYLQGDTAIDALTYTRHQMVNNAYSNTDKIDFKTEQTRQAKDTFQLRLPLKDALITKSLPSLTSGLFLPAPYQFNYTFRLTADAPFALSADSTWLAQLPLALPYKLNYSAQADGPKAYLIKIEAAVEVPYIAAQNIDSYLHFYKLLNKGIPLTISKKNES